MDADLADTLRGPTCVETLDAYVPPVALAKAALAGLPTPEWSLTQGAFDAPCLVERVVPDRGAALVVRDAHEAERAADSLRAAPSVLCVQRMAEGAEILEIRVVRGHTTEIGFEGWAAAVDQVFRLPLATLRLIRRGFRTEFSGLGPLDPATLTDAERAWLEPTRELVHA